MTRPTDQGPRISTRVAELQGNSLGEIFLMARERQGIDMALGTPGYPETTLDIIGAANDAIRAGKNQYVFPPGDSQLRERIAATLPVPSDPETELTVTVGGTEALFLALHTFVDPGDEVVLLDPGYEQFRSTVAFAGGVPRHVPLHAPDW
ncbi:aminotransferase class I/II-fold pyridoxal phosphate-dependent enzyme, partial [Streptomyces sp. SID7982]|nr:aminotransferase class I/II-fold pyridoxal phosphate-dependent enzyme [Streptomyces sp. SID7982]